MGPRRYLSDHSPVLDEQLIENPCQWAVSYLHICPISKWAAQGVGRLPRSRPLLHSHDGLGEAIVQFVDMT